MPSLWEFSLRFYEQPGVADACLLLQDEWQADVNLVLFTLWSALRARHVDDGHVAAACAATRDWQADIVTPLRRIRRKLKSREAAQAQLDLRAQVKTAELEAERQELEVLSTCSTAPAPPTRARRDLARDNLRSYIQTLPAQPPDRETALLIAAFGCMLDES